MRGNGRAWLSYLNILLLKTNFRAAGCRAGAYIALALIISTHSNHSVVRFKTDCVSITRVRGHMNITSRDRHNIAPTAHITLDIFIIPHSGHRTVRFKQGGMTMTRCEGGQLADCVPHLLDATGFIIESPLIPNFIDSIAEPSRVFNDSVR